MRQTQTIWTKVGEDALARVSCDMPRIRLTFITVVYLAECRQYKDKNSDLKDVQDHQSYLLYHEVFDYTRNNDSFTWSAWAHPSYPKKQRVDAMGSQVDWTLATEDDMIHAKFDKLDRTFTVHSLSEKGDPITQATGVADLGGHGMRCYRDNSTAITFGLSGHYNRCLAQYFCTRERRQIRRTQFSISEQTVGVEILAQTPQDLNLPKGQRDPRVDGVISNVYYWLSRMDPGEGGGAKEYIIDSQTKKHSVRFDWQAGQGSKDPGYDPRRIKLVSEYLVKTLNTEIEKKTKGDGSTYTTQTWVKYKAPFPAHIRVQFQIAFQEQLDWKPTDTIDIYIITHNEAACGTDAAWAKLLSGLFGAGAAVLTGGASAIASGLGGVFGAYHTAACLTA